MASQPSHLRTPLSISSNYTPDSAVVDTPGKPDSTVAGPNPLRYVFRLTRRSLGASSDTSKCIFVDIYIGICIINGLLLFSEFPAHVGTTNIYFRLCHWKTDDPTNIDA